MQSGFLQPFKFRRYLRSSASNTGFVVYLHHMFDHLLKQVCSHSAASRFGKGREIDQRHPYMSAGPEGPDGHNRNQPQDSLQCHPFTRRKETSVRFGNLETSPERCKNMPPQKCPIIPNISGFQDAFVVQFLILSSSPIFCFDLFNQIFVVC